MIQWKIQTLLMTILERICNDVAFIVDGVTKLKVPL